MPATRGNFGTQSPNEDNRNRPMPLIKDESPLNLKGPGMEVICALLKLRFFSFLQCYSKVSLGVLSALLRQRPCYIYTESHCHPQKCGTL